jgi:hypothetical protein
MWDDQKVFMDGVIKFIKDVDQGSFWLNQFEILRSKASFWISFEERVQKN